MTNHKEPIGKFLLWLLSETFALILLAIISLTINVIWFVIIEPLFFFMKKLIKNIKMYNYIFYFWDNTYFICQADSLFSAKLALEEKYPSINFETDIKTHKRFVN